MSKWLVDIFIGLDFKSCFDLNTAEKVNLIKNSPTTDEVVTEEELTKLFDEKSSPNHYIGLEISGFLHLGSLIRFTFSAVFKSKQLLKSKPIKISTGYFYILSYDNTWLIQIFFKFFLWNNFMF